MKEENHQDPIQNLAKKLREHSLPYKEGAWEQFEAKVQQDKKPLALWPYFSAAAVLLIAISLIFISEQKQDIVPVLSERTMEMNEGKALPKIGEELADIDNNQSITDRSESDFTKEKYKKVDERELMAFQSQESASKLYVEQNSQPQDVVSIASIHEPESSAVHDVDNSAVNLAAKPAIDAAKSNVIARITNDKPTPSFAEKKESKNIDKKATTDALAELLRTEVAAQYVNQELDKKWSFGVDVSPNVGTNNQVNLGGGVALSYAVSSRVSISSGISYLQVGAERDPFASSGQIPSSSPADRVLALAGKEKTKTLNKANTSLGGLDIPLNVNYQLSKRVHASAGVSVFNVLTEQNLNSYHNQESAIVYSGKGLKRPEPVVRSFYSEEVSPEKNYEGNLNGFINFSVGYAIPLSEKIGVSLEPFVKIPMGSVNENQFNLNNGGLRISTRF